LFIPVNFWLKRLIKEWLFLSATLGVFATSVYLKSLPEYTLSDFRVLFVIFLFLVVLKGLENTNLLYFVASFISKGRYVAIKLVCLVAFLSMFITNDIALLMVVPLTMILDIKHRDIVVILEALSANAASALLPSGNPQNMFIYWFYNLSLSQFILTIYPFVVVSLAIISIIAVFIPSSSIGELPKKDVKENYKIYLVLLALSLGIILKILPIYLGLLVIAYPVLFDRASFKIDYFLLGIFFMFFGFTSNIQHIIHITINSSNGIFVFSAFLSQVISNVPAALIFADFTKDWKELLWGVSVGGYGNLIGSLANLIAYRIYVSYKGKSKKFLLKFMAFGYLFFFVMLCLKIYVFSAF